MRTIPELKEGTHRAKATGTLPNGKPVIVNADGTVSVVAGTAQAVGSATVFEAAATNYTSAIFDSNSNKVVIAYEDDANSDYGTAIVGTVSGTNISFGSAVVFEPSSVMLISATFDSNLNKVVIAYRDNGNSSYGTAIVGTVSGTSISFGTAAVFESASTNYISSTFDSNSNKVVIAYTDQGNSSYGTAIVGTVSGTSISFGTAVVFESANCYWIASTFDSSSNKVVIAYRDANNSHYGTAIVGTVSGTNISFGTAVVYNAAISNYTAATFDSNSNKVVIVYSSTAETTVGTAIVGTVSGTSISFGSSVVFQNVNPSYISAIFDSSFNQVILSYRDNTVGNGTIVVGTVSGTTISFGTPLVFNAASTFYTAATFDSNSNKTVVSYSDGGNSYYGTGIVFQNGSTNLTSENYIGISQGGTYADGSSATVDIIGTLNEDQSGLTAGQSYYVQTDGTIGETAADPSVFAGTAISATSLVVKT